MNNTSRRDFLKSAGALAVMANTGLLRVPVSAGARRGGQPVLVAIYLRGGADFLNMVIPYKDKRYEEVRPRSP